MEWLIRGLKARPWPRVLQGQCALASLDHRELMQPIPTSHQTHEAVLDHMLTPKDPLLARLYNLLLTFPRSGSRRKIRSKQIVGYPIAIFVQILGEWRGGGVAVRISPAAFTKYPK